MSERYLITGGAGNLACQLTFALARPDDTVTLMGGNPGRETRDSHLFRGTWKVTSTLSASDRHRRVLAVNDDFDEGNQDALGNPVADISPTPARPTPAGIETRKRDRSNSFLIKLKAPIDSIK